MAFTYNECSEEISCLSDPVDDSGRNRIPSLDLVVDNTDMRLFQLQFQAASPSPIYSDTFSLIVDIDGACYGNVTP